MSVLNCSDSVIIVLHEIYGINMHVSKVCKYYEKNGFNVICPNMLDCGPFDYEHEDAAYEYFMKNIGFDLAVGKVMKLIAQVKRKYKHVFLLGFSIGATIAWLCSDKEPSCKGIIGYYGSRIRDNTNKTPSCPALLIFASEEKSFDPMELSQELEKKTNVKVHILSGKHGFSDSFSKKYYEESDKAAIELVKNFIKNRGL